MLRADEARMVALSEVLERTPLTDRAGRLVPLVEQATSEEAFMPPRPGPPGLLGLFPSELLVTSFPNLSGRGPSRPSTSTGG